MIYLKTYENYQNKQEFILLVGPPGSGKSTYINEVNKNGDYIVINRDDIAIEIAEKNGLTYKDMFSRPNLILGDDREYHEIEPEYYEKDGKTYMKGYEYLGEIIDLPDDNYMKKWIDKTFKILLELNNEVAEEVENAFSRAINSNKSIIVDMTNVFSGYRQSQIDKLGSKRDEFIVKAIVFNNGGVGMENEIIKVNKKRDKELRKSHREKDIPEKVIKSFIDRYEEPSRETEDIDEVEFIETRGGLLKFINENYLTKKYQRKDKYDEYLYDNGFGDRYYICSNCGSNKLTPTPSGGFSPPKWKCDNCGEDVNAPLWFTPEEYEDMLASREAEKYNM